jgi:putative flippase GtrA
MKTTSKIVDLPELLPYVLIGGIATVIDWTMFSVSVTWLHIHYQIALGLGYASGGVFHYCSNKFITFKCRSKEIGSQLSLYILVGSMSLLCSMAVLAALVNILLINKIISRILTTGIMIFPNYLLHKHISFSKKIFTQPKIS